MVSVESREHGQPCSVLPETYIYTNQLALRRVFTWYRDMIETSLTLSPEAHEARV